MTTGSVTFETRNGKRVVGKGRRRLWLKVEGTSVSKGPYFFTERRVYTVRLFDGECDSRETQKSPFIPLKFTPLGKYIEASID